HFYANFLQFFRLFVDLSVTAADGVTAVYKMLRQRTHANTADSHKMHFVREIFFHNSTIYVPPHAKGNKRHTFVEILFLCAAFVPVVNTQKATPSHSPSMFANTVVVWTNPHKKICSNTKSEKGF